MKDFSTKLSNKVQTFVPPLTELKPVIENGLKKNYKEVHVDIVPCPDLSAKPFLMTGSGIGKHLRVAEIGGLGNLFPKIETDKFFDLKEVAQTVELPKSFVFGPGAGPWHLVGKNSECVADANFTVEPAKVTKNINNIN